jgi:hypothetical protein
MAPRLGFEPKLPGPEPGVLPLDDLGTLFTFYRKIIDLKVQRPNQRNVCFISDHH